jgi:hypothetical protein
VKIAYIDLIAGASGDMLLGALVDCGLPVADLQEGLAGLHLEGFRLTQTRVMRGAFSATKMDVEVTDLEHARNLAEIGAVIAAGALPDDIKVRAMRIFTRMTEVEAGIHHMPVEQVHLHELGALDTIVDVTGVLLGLRLLGVEQVIVSPVPLGRGTINGAHGRIPLPAPATIALLKDAPIVGVDVALETVTPTAAALLTELAAGYGPIPSMRLTATGYGAGGRTTPEPNILRILVGDGAAADAEIGTLDVLETNIDNMNPEVYGYVLERLLAGGALDVYMTPIVMKKNRPGVILNVLCRPEDSDHLRALVFAETTTLGIRTQHVMRHALPRRSVTVTTLYGAIRVKAAQWDGEEKVAPEYEDCATAAQAAGVPLRTVYEAALAAYRARP